MRELAAAAQGMLLTTVEQWQRSSAGQQQQQIPNGDDAAAGGGTQLGAAASGFMGFLSNRCAGLNTAEDVLRGCCVPGAPTPVEGWSHAARPTHPSAAAACARFCFCNASPPPRSPLWIAIACFAVAQVLKLIINFYETSSWQYERLVGSGGASQTSAWAAATASVFSLALGPHAASVPAATSRRTRPPLQLTRPCTLARRPQACPARTLRSSWAWRRPWPSGTGPAAPPLPSPSSSPR